ATGLVVGYVASRVVPRRGEALSALVIAAVAYVVAVLPPHGNGLISAFVCAIVVAVRRPDMRTSFEGRAELLIQVVKLGVFFVFGALLTLDGLFTDGFAAVALVVLLLLVARPVAVFIALIGTRTDVATRAFMAW